jgi:hypothetical protein
MIDLNLVMPLSDDQRAAYGRIADVLICESDEMPSATQVDVHTRWIDEALRLRPDLRSALDVAIGLVPPEADARDAVEDIASARPEVFEALGTLTAGSYYMDDRVRALMGYPGQEARRLVDDTDQYLDLLERVVERGPLYRPTPA